MKKASFYILTTLIIAFSTLTIQAASGPESSTSPIPAVLTITQAAPAVKSLENVTPSPVATEAPKEKARTKKNRANTGDGLGGGVYLSVGAIIIILLLLIILL